MLWLGPEWVIEFDDEHYCEERESLTFECELNTALQLKKFPVKWFKNEIEISKRDDDYRIISKGVFHSLTIRRANPADNGSEFVAKCSNQIIKTKIFVKEKDAIFEEELPTMLKLKTDQEDAKLTCVTNIAKNVELKWTKGTFVNIIKTLLYSNFQSLEHYVNI